MYDLAIIGAGISGLTLAYKVLKQNPSWNVAVLEATRNIGGRAQLATFAGHQVPIGAGVGRKKDVLLTALLEDLGVPWRESAVQHDTPAQLAQLRANMPRSGETFAEYGRRVLGRASYSAFIAAMGFSDMERADAAETLRNYGLEDNTSSWTAMHIDWNLLSHTLAARITAMNGKILLNTPVYHVGKNTIVLSKSKIQAHGIVVAANIATIRAVLPKQLRPLYKHVHGQPFLRTYARFSKKTRPLMPRSSVVVQQPLQKIIPIDPDAGIYMIAYSDNASAVKLQKLEDKEEWARLVEAAIELEPNSLKITSLAKYFWREGTHYYDPKCDFTKDARRWHPAPNIWVVGEAVSHNQGWCEGALQTVEHVIHLEYFNPHNP